MPTLIENTLSLSTNIIKKDLRKARWNEPVNGCLNVLWNNELVPINYWTEYDGKDSYLVVTFGVESQRILLSEQPVTFGCRTYLTCDCGRRTNALYLQDGTFACRHCHGVKYQSTAINRKTKHGRFLYRQSQILKLIAKRETISRIFYKSQYSKRFSKWLDMCDKVGLKEEVLSASNLMSAINEYQQI